MTLAWRSANGRTHRCPRCGTVEECGLKVPGAHICFECLYAWGWINSGRKGGVMR